MTTYLVAMLAKYLVLGVPRSVLHDEVVGAEIELNTLDTIQRCT